MRVTVRVPLLWVVLLAFCLACVVACVVAWFVLLSTICSSPRAPIPQQHVIPYNCHGMTVFLSPLQDAMLHWLGPVGLLGILVGMIAAARVARAVAESRQIDGHHAARVRISAVPPGEAPA